MSNNEFELTHPLTHDEGVSPVQPAGQNIRIGKYNGTAFEPDYQCQFNGVGRYLQFVKPNDTITFDLLNQYVEMRLWYHSSEQAFYATVDEVDNPDSFDYYFRGSTGRAPASQFSGNMPPPTNKVSFIGNGDIRDYTTEDPIGDTISFPSEVQIIFNMVYATGGGGFNKLKLKIVTS